MLTAKGIINKINEAATVWEVELQTKNGTPIKPFQMLFKGEIEKCVNYLKSNASSLKDSSGVLVSDNRIGNVFFKFDNGNLVTSVSPYPGLKYNTTSGFKPFK